MEILSKGGFSLPVVLGFFLEIFALECLGYAATQSTNPDLVSTAGESLSISGIPDSTPVSASESQSTRSEPDKNASFALENALNNQNQANPETDRQNAYNHSDTNTASEQQTASVSNAAGQDQFSDANSSNEAGYQPTPKNQPDLNTTTKKKYVTTHAKKQSQEQKVPQERGYHRPFALTPLGQSTIVGIQSPGYIEVGARNYKVTNNFGSWNDQYVLGVFQTDSKNVWTVQLEHDQRFFERGNYAVVENTHTINDDWYSSLSAGISDNATVIPKYYVGGTIFHKQGPRKQIVAYLGAHGYWWRGGSSTEDINPGIIYYFESPWVLEGGAFINRGNPGAVYSANGYIAATQGMEKDHYYTLRFGFGKEAYLPVFEGPAAVVAYPSYVVTGTWRKWLGRNWGFNISGEFYHNTFYNRYGGTYGLFMDFG